MDTDKHGNLLYKELSYQIQGAAIEVRKNFGSGLKETIYQNAFAEELKARNIKFDKEKSIQIFSPKTGKLVGSYRPDFIIEDKILIELKAVEKIPKMFLDQLFSYLRNSKYELGYFINFASPKLYIKRIIFTNDRKSFLKNLLASISLIFVLFSVFASSTQAAQISFDAKTAQAQIGEKFEVKLLVNAEQESINAFEGKIIFPRDILDLREIRDGNSIVNFWIDPVRNCVFNGVEKPDAICFSGITPGGFQGNSGLLFSVVFEAKREGVARFEINDARVLRNDGIGSVVTLTIAPFEVAISKGAPAEIPAIPKIKDRERPESFMPEIAKDATLFDGKWFIVFATQDKSSGIDHYEIKESRQRILSVFKKWVTAESPYALSDQELRSYIWIKAVDKAGNKRIVEIAPRNSLAWYENYENWIMIIVGVFLFIILYLWRRKLKH